MKGQRLLRQAARSAFILGVFALTIEGARRLLNFSTGSIDVPVTGIVLFTCVIVLAGAGVLIRDHRYWRTQRIELETLLQQVLQREAAMSELKTVGGGMKPLLEPILSIFRELRSQQVRLKQLELEIRQKVQQRTDALQRQLGSLQQQAARDGLTGLYNRRALDQELPRLVDEAVGAARHLTLLMIDLDHFKKLNDTLGHSAGDEFLVNVSQLIRSAAPDGSLGFRYGGDELALLLLDCDEITARDIAQRLTRMVHDLARPLKVTPKPGVSIGMASLDGRVGDSTALLKLADADLYRVKSARKTARAA